MLKFSPCLPGKEQSHADCHVGTHPNKCRALSYAWTLLGKITVCRRAKSWQKMDYQSAWMIRSQCLKPCVALLQLADADVTTENCACSQHGTLLSGKQARRGRVTANIPTLARPHFYCPPAAGKEQGPDSALGYAGANQEQLQ